MANEGDRIDEVDKWLAAQEGKIVKKREDLHCRHGPKEKCTKCLPIDPYDEEYLKEREIKHMSFHAYIRKLLDANRGGRGSGSQQPLENVTCHIEPNCPGGHQPYPKGVCTKCQPPMLTLNRQRYRHVDNVEIENHEVVDRFLNFWRKTGFQRAGFLIGRYEVHPDVPLGIKAVVAAIYEPPQKNGENFTNLEADPNEEKVDAVCSALGMKRVGWIFTDLVPESTSDGTLKYTRSEDSFLFSAEECITAGDLQSKHRNYTPYCRDGYFGSKFVSVVASGDKSKQINFHGYQVSNQCTAMVEANILCPTSRPELAWVREKPLTPSQYITEVQYTEKNEYGADVMRNGRPMPVEYLLVDVPTGVPIEPKGTFTTVPDAARSFPIENRAIIPELQDMKSLARYRNNFRDEPFIKLASNFHFLLFLLTNRVVAFTMDEVLQLADAVAKKDATAAEQWAVNTGNWQTVLQLMHADHQPRDQAQSSGGSSASSDGVPCPHCTFKNEGGATGDCSVCGLPLLN